VSILLVNHMTQAMFLSPKILAPIYAHVLHERSLLTFWQSVPRGVSIVCGGDNGVWR
jgi:hypothetical protein